MIRRLAFCLLLLWPQWALSQGTTDEAGAAPAPAAAPADTTVPEEAFDPALTGTARDPAWERLAQRAEALAGTEDASLFAIQRLRAELVIWRDRFLARSDLNAGRLQTVEAQLAAIAPEAEGGDEPALVTERRAALQDQRDALLAPRLLAQEAYARADGLIAEFDARALRDQAEAVTTRGPSPLNPTFIVSGLAAVVELGQLLVAETGAQIHLQNRENRLLPVLPRALVMIIAGVVLLGIGRRYVTRWRSALAARGGRMLELRLFLLSLIQIVVPLVGLLLLSEGLQLPGIFGLRGDAIAGQIPAAGSFVIIAWWLTKHVFPTGGDDGQLGYDAETRAAGRRYGLLLAWFLAVTALLQAGVRTLEIDDGTLAALEFPLILLISLIFWRLGRVIKTAPAVDEDEQAMGRNRGLIGRAITVVAVLAPILAAFGYGAAASSLLVPAIISVTLIGVIYLVQQIVQDLSRMEEGQDSVGSFALVPVLISFVIYLLSLPVFALIWGASVNDLRELWARFREGFNIGETQISPTDFLTFAVVFALGYLLTRFIQSTLRKSVLPRTRLDLGGQNAVVAGVGYVGIILAAIVAITSAGLDLSSIAIVAGALSVGIGFGMQNIVSNFVSGIILLIERPISEGDWIEVGDRMGIVKSISVRSTRIEAFDKTDVIIPNADLVSGQVTNWTRGNTSGRLIVKVGVAYGTDTDKVMTILREIAEANPMVVLTPPPSILFMGFGADSLDFEIRAILRDISYIFVVQTELNLEIDKRFREEGIEIPFAQRDIWLRNPEVLKDTPT
ncbi:MAG: DUF3772 domain-containing protein [Pseudomonadota bacterium]